MKTIDLPPPTGYVKEQGLVFHTTLMLDDIAKTIVRLQNMDKRFSAEKNEEALTNLGMVVVSLANLEKILEDVKPAE